MTETELRFWEDAVANATLGPWETGDPYDQRTKEPLGVYGMGMEVADAQTVRDATFIAASREAMPALIAEVRSLRAERDALRKDAALLDALQAEHERFDPVAALVVKVKHDRNGSDWANVMGDIRAALTAALEVQP